MDTSGLQGGKDWIGDGRDGGRGFEERRDCVGWILGDFDVDHWIMDFEE